MTFTISDEAKWQGKAREKAMADAVARAEELPRVAGVELGAVLSVSEVVGGVPVPMRVAERAFGGGGIAPGELELGTQVRVTFAIQKRRKRTRSGREILFLPSFCSACRHFRSCAEQAMAD